MPAKITFGHAVQLATVAPRPARLCVVGGAYWNGNGSASYAGFNGAGSADDTRYQADSRRTLAAMVKWLTGKASGARVLICGDAIAGHAWGTQFRDGLEAAGHTFVVTGSMSDWAGYEPTDYDLLCCGNDLSAFEYHGLATDQEKVDYVLEQGTSILSETTGSGGGVWEAYGITNTGGYHESVATLGIHYGSDGPTAWRCQRPFYCEQFGEDLYALVMYTTMRVHPGTNTRGGQTAFMDCVCADGADAHHSHYPPETYVLGLWWQ